MTPAAVEEIDRRGNVTQHQRRGFYCGTFLGDAEYAGMAGYLPTPTGCPEAILRPCAQDRNNRVRVMA
jgi:hypothetical protein